jgi:hypothetical protein
MRKDTIQWLIPALLAVAAAVAFWFYWTASNRTERPAQTPPTETGAPADAGNGLGPRHPLPAPQEPGERPALRPLPPLDQSDE